MKTVVFCLPGNRFSHHFLQCWTNLLGALPAKDIVPVIRGAYTSNIYTVRNACLDGQLPGPTHQVPFQDAFGYDYIMWLDSDMVFEPDNFFTLYNYLETHPKISLISGLCHFPEAKHFTAIKSFNRQHLDLHHRLPYLTDADIKKAKRPKKVFSNGLFFMLVRQGVFEAIDFPWFNPLPHDLGKDHVGLMGEDVAFCLRAAQAGFPTYVHPQVLIGHEKPGIIQPK